MLRLMRLLCAAALRVYYQCVATLRHEAITNPAIDALLATGRQLKRLSPADTAMLAAELLPHLSNSPR